MRVPLHIRYVALVRLPTERAHGYAIMKMCEQFAGQGARVELLVPRRRYGIKADPFAFYGAERNFSIRKLWASDFLGLIERTSLPFLTDNATFIFSLLRERFPENDVIYTRDYLVALFACARNIAFEIHSIPQKNRLFWRALSRADCLIVISRGLRSALVEHGVPRDKILVAPDAVDLNEFNIEPSRETTWKELGVGPKKKIVLYTGHFYGWKGAETLAQAARFSPDNIAVVLMGGIDRELLDFQRRYASAKVHVVRFQERGKLAAFIKSADLLVLPNSGKEKISSHYTSPLKLFQYMASGVPIVASDLPSIREILDDSMTYWARPDDPQDLARAIERALADPGASEKAARAKKEAEKYTWDARARAILDFLNRASPPQDAHRVT